MTKSRWMRILLVVGSILILIGVWLMLQWYLGRDDNNTIEVIIDSSETETLKFENLSMLPGEECEYSVVLKSRVSNECDISLDFIDTDETKERSLKDYAYVKIIAEDTVICDALLSEVFEAEAMILPVNFVTGENTELTIIYYLPIDVGNEAKNAEAVFELRITATNE